jgi:hypothetical protein
MAALVQVEATSLLNASFGKVTFPAPTTPMMLRLMTANGSATSAGTQVTGGTYTPQNLTTALGSNAAAGSIANTAVINYTLMPATTVVGVEVWDSAGTPVRKWFGALTTSQTTNSGDTVSVAIGALVASLG